MHSLHSYNAAKPSSFCVVGLAVTTVGGMGIFWVNLGDYNIIGFNIFFSLHTLELNSGSKSKKISEKVAKYLNECSLRNRVIRHLPLKGP